MIFAEMVVCEVFEGDFVEGGVSKPSINNYKPYSPMIQYNNNLVRNFSGDGDS
jgi:hypothetical protein